MRVLLAAALALALVLVVAEAHVHARAAHDDCAVCVLRGADAQPASALDVAPVIRAAGEAAVAPDLPPVTGAPLGAVPGQSPPRAA